MECIVLLRISKPYLNLINSYKIVSSILDKIHTKEELVARHCHKIYPAEKMFLDLDDDNERFKRELLSLIAERIPNNRTCKWTL